jgi:hypothetical protein
VGIHCAPYHTTCLQCLAPQGSARPREDAPTLVLGALCLPKSHRNSAGNRCIAPSRGEVGRGPAALARLDSGRRGRGVGGLPSSGRSGVGRPVGRASARLWRTGHGGVKPRPTMGPGSPFQTGANLNKPLNLHRQPSEKPHIKNVPTRDIQNPARKSRPFSRLFACRSPLPAAGCGKIFQEPP